MTLTLVACATTSPVFAQSEGRVVRDGATIWRTDVPLAAAVARAGTVLRITAQLDRWYEVVVPPELGGRGERGLIAISSVQLLPGTPKPPMRIPGAPAVSVPREPQIGQRPTTAPEPAMAFRAFGQATYTRLNARQSFEAVLGEAHGPSFGAGAEVRFRGGLFAQASWDQFRKTGERVFVFEDTVFPLGVPNTITITPIKLTGGYRFVAGRSAVPYFGAGVGSYRLEERTPFTEPAEEFDERFEGYHVVGGLEFRAARWIATAVEIEYSSVPEALGFGGISQIFDEQNLGGIQIRAKLLVGR